MTVVRAAYMCLLSLCGGLLTPVFAADTTDAFNQGKSFTSSLSTDTGTAAKSGSFAAGEKTFGVGDVTDMSVSRGGTGELANPPEVSGNLDPTKAYNADDSAGAAGRWVSDAFANRPTFTIDPKTDPLIKGAQDIKNNPQAYAGTLDSSYAACKTISVDGSASVETKVCQESKQTKSGGCEQRLEIAVKSSTTCVAGSVLAAGNDGCRKRDGTDWHRAYSAALCDVTKPGYQRIGAIAGADIGTFASSGCKHYAAPNPKSDGFPQFWLPEANTSELTYLSNYNGAMYYKGGCDADACSYQIHFESGAIHTLNFHRARMDVALDKETWSDTCPTILANAGCKVGPAMCVEGPACKDFTGLQLCRDCWRYEQHYGCLTAGATINNCQILRDAGCSQTGSRCIASNANGICGAFEQTYQCQTTAGSSTQVTACANDMTCLDGTCFDTTAPPNQDFALAATHLNVMKEMGQDFDPNTLTIFKGQPFDCTKTFLDISNCCGDKGWGLDLNLASCSAEEKQLVQNAQGGRCHQVGSYCSDKTVLGLCTQTKVQWCCFSSKLSRIINEQGRPQLGKGWGTAESPDCTGFTVDEIQKLDFAAMDLSEFYTDVMAKAKMLDVGQMSTAISTRISNYYDTGTHSIPVDAATPYNTRIAPSVK